jgi:hypothetical protein
MNDPTNRQAMIAVERVVRPVRASLARKQRMRYRASVTSTSHRLKRPNACSMRRCVGRMALAQYHFERLCPSLAMARGCVSGEPGLRRLFRARGSQRPGRLPTRW